MKEKLAFVPALTDAVALGTKNVASILGAAVLYILTIWIPYLNVGTTIAICNLPVELSKGKVVNPLSIFDAKYRRQMGEFILLEAMMQVGIGVAVLFLIAPAIVLGISWSQAVYLLLDKKLNWAQCLTESNRITMGYKWKIFFLKLVLWVIGGILAAMFSKLFLLLLIVVMVLLAASIALDAVIYRELSSEEETAE